MEARWRTCREWRSAAGTERIGPMTTPAIWKPGTTSRIAAKVAASPYTVLDFDGFDGVQPCTAAEHREHIDGSLALVRWLRDDLDWPLAAMLWSGSKSIHAWFHTPPPDVLESLRKTSTALGIDPGLIGRPEHPCRLPGHIHPKTGMRSRVLWLQDPSAP